ncbi:MAG: DUF2934 domain-containing protein [Candidatus Aceula meridiana]|nr:DUF2934 domain-containing protein [Candidatus Aceula meridiana]
MGRKNEMEEDIVSEKKRNHIKKKRGGFKKESDDFEDSRRPNRKKIAERAYKLYEERDRAHGSDWDDWLEAEKEIEGG